MHEKSQREFYSQMYFDDNKMMICIRERYFTFNRITLLAVGLWPYQQTKLVQFQLAVFLGILISFVAFQLSRLMFVECTFDFIIKMLSISMLYIFLVIKYISFWLNIETIRCFFERLQYVYDGLQDTNEIAIYDKYGNFAKRSTIYIISIGVLKKRMFSSRNICFAFYDNTPKLAIRF